MWLLVWNIIQAHLSDEIDSLYVADGWSLRRSAPQELFRMMLFGLSNLVYSIIEITDDAATHIRSVTTVHVLLYYCMSTSNVPDADDQFTSSSFAEKNSKRGRCAGVLASCGA